MWLRRSLLTSKANIRLISSQAEAGVKFDDIGTLESNPTKHTEAHIGRFYTIDPNVRKTTLHKTTMPKKYFDDAKAFTELRIMMREPAVEVINYLNNTDYTKPVNRFVFYGELGADRYRLIDINIDAAAWLIHFKTQNGDLLKKLDLKTSKEYVWSQRESTPANSTLLELIEHGINRIKFATATISVLVDELKQRSTDGKCKTMVAIDGFNAFFHPKTFIKFDNKMKATPQDITITEPFLNIVKPDWSGGVVLLVVDKWALTEDHMESDLPKYLLRPEGFEHIDPFVPIRVGIYDHEFENMINYYLDRKWIASYKPGLEKELKFLSGGNGYKLKLLTAPL